jgi:hypothetical protein
MSNIAVKNLVDASLSIAQEKSALGNYSEAIEGMTTIIQAIENNDRKTLAAYGPQMVQMYCLRAKLLFENSNQGTISTKVELAQKDIQKAEAAFDEFYGGMDPTQKERLRASIHNMINSDEKMRNDNFAVISQIGTIIQPPLEMASRPMPDSRLPSGLSAVFTGKWGEKLPAFLIGAFLWSIPIAISAFGGFNLGVFVLGFVLWIFCMIGWDSFPVGGGGGTQLKMMATWFLMVTIIGMIPIAYWTGKYILQWYVKNAR